MMSLPGVGVKFRRRLATLKIALANAKLFISKKKLGVRVTLFPLSLGYFERCLESKSVDNYKKNKRKLKT